ncbi:MAG: DUF4143 domain-containing protein [Muribaculaceae bacterium]|nr:DUF4143 domain-containing protein [Muribaculaceae bacterium]
MKYIERIADIVLKERLESKGAVLIEGPKWCGKTSTALQMSKSVLNLSDINILEESKVLASINPSILLEGNTPRLIDEWQEIPTLWDAIRCEVDKRQSMEQFILTGSAVPANRDEIRHTGTGRFSRMVMRTMSLSESGESNGEIHLSSLFDQANNLISQNTLELGDIARLICRGGWPMAIQLHEKAALRQAVDYYDAVINFDISRVDGVRRSPITANNILRSYARHIGYQTPLTTIRDDISNNGVIDINTVNSYLNALKQVYVIEEAPAWNPNLRSKTAIRTTETRYFNDPSIGCAALGIGPGDLMRDLKLLGMLFENLCIRDLRIYSEILDGKIYHYRDSNGLECDAVIHLRNGKYGLIEIKLGGEKQTEEGASSLLKLSSKIDTDKMSSPSFLMVLTAVGKYAYQRKDGVWIVPIGTLTY